tara:strand:- start:1811 stop:2875 length:1065 start_codon:yes stop_codon:yes gene_type:complete
MKTVKITTDDILVDNFFDIPEVEPGRVIIRTRQAGICGSDLHRMTELHAQSDPAKHLFIGHEVSGDIYAVGEDVTNLDPGTRVAIEPIQRCTKCINCKSGKYTFCDQVDRRMAIGWNLSKPGGHSEYFDIPAYAAVPIPNSLSYTEGALVEPLAVGVHAIRMANPGHQASIAVLGTGTIGLMCIAAAAEFVPRELICIYRHEHQRDAAQQLGATRCIKADKSCSPEDLSSKLNQLEKPDIVIEAVGGSSGSMDYAMELVRPSGTISITGAFWGESSININPIVEKGLRIVGSICYNNSGNDISDFSQAINLLSKRPQIAQTMVTHQYAIEDAKTAYETALDKSTGAIKVLLTCI